MFSVVNPPSNKGSKYIHMDEIEVKNILNVVDIQFYL